VSQVVVDLAGNESFETAHDVAFGEAFGAAAFHMGDRPRTESKADDADHVQGAVGVPVADAAQSHRSEPPEETGIGATPQSRGEGGVGTTDQAAWFPRKRVER
jgi:hypothetical protein